MKFSGALWIGDQFILIDELRLWEPCNWLHSQNVHSHICTSAKRKPSEFAVESNHYPHLDGHSYTWTIKRAAGSKYMHFTSSLTAKMYFNKIFTEKGVDSSNRWCFKPFNLTWLSVFECFFLSFSHPSVKKHDTRLNSINMPHAGNKKWITGSQVWYGTDMERYRGTQMQQSYECD